MRVFTLLFLLTFTINIFGQSREGLIQLEFKNYVDKATLGEVVGEGNTVDGKKVGAWIYYMFYDRNILYYTGNYIDGRKEGVWNNYALLPPMGYTDNFDLVRSSETWKNDLLYRFKMGQNNILLMIDTGLGEPYVSELKRLDEAFENSYRRTHGKTITPEFGESVESLQSRLIPMLRTELLKSKKKAELRFSTIGNQLKLHEKYDSGSIIYQLIQNWENNVLYSKEIYKNEVLREKYLFMGGDPNDMIHYEYFDNGEMAFMKHFKNDTIPIGRWIENYPDGKKKSQGNYVDGKMDGKWKYWDEKGNMKVMKYENGEIQE